MSRSFRMPLSRMRPLAMLLAAVLVVPLARSESRVAVVSFDSPSTAGTNDSWTAGLPELLELELQDRGVPLYTRRFIGLLLKERQLDASGLLKEGSLVRKVLPDVDYLVKGSLSKEGRSGFILEVKVAEALSGREVQSFSGKGQYPKDVMGVIASAAGALAPGLGHPRSTAAPALAFPGFTRIPEALGPFYEGMAYCLAGRPAYALDSFTRALDLDERFLTAVLWKMRCYEALGLTDHAQLEYTDLLSRQTRFKIPMMADPGVADQKPGRMMTVLFSNGKWEFRPEQKTALKEMMRKGDYRIFTPEWLNEMTDESDLRLSGEFGMLEKLDARLWLQVEWLACFSAQGAESDPRIGLKQVNLLTGQSVGPVMLPAAEAVRLLDVLRKQAPMKSERVLGEPVAPETARSFNLYNRMIFARNLVALARDPESRALKKALMDSYPPSERMHRGYLGKKLAETMGPDELNAGGKLGRIDALRAQNRDPLEGIAPDDPDLPCLKLHVLFRKNESLWLARHLDPAALMKAYEPFLAQYPDGWDSICLRASLGMAGCSVRDGWKTYGPLMMGAADDILATVPKRVDGSLNVDSLGETTCACLGGILLHAAYAACRSGLFEKAADYLAHKDETGVFDFHRYVRAAPRESRQGQPAEWVQVDGPGLLLLNGIYYSGQESVMDLVNNAIQERDSAMITLMDVIHQVEAATPAEAVEPGFRYCRQLAKSLKANRFSHQQELWTTTPKVLGKIREGCRPEQMEEVRRWGLILAEYAGFESARNTLLLVSGNENRLKELIEEPVLKGDVPAFYFWLSLVQLPDQPDAQGLVLADLLPRLEERLGAAALYEQLMYAAQVWEHEEKIDKAAETYEKLIKALDSGAPKCTAMFQLAILERNRGQFLRASELLKAIIRTPGSDKWRLELVRGHGLLNPPGVPTEQKWSLQPESLALLGTIRSDLEKGGSGTVLSGKGTRQ